MQREHRERLELMAQASEIGFWFCDLPFEKLVWDDRVKEHFWYPSDAEVNIDMFYQRLRPEDREGTRETIERVHCEPAAIRYRVLHSGRRWAHQVDSRHRLSLF
jgi:PAS domain-containing protein